MNECFRLMLRLFLAYLGALIVGMLLITINNIVFFQQSLADLLQFNIPFIAISSTVFSLLLLLLTSIRLLPILRNMQELFINENLQSSKLTYQEGAVLFRIILRFPYELFTKVIVISIFFIALFHSVEVLQTDFSMQTGWKGMWISVISELSLACIIALMLLSLSRAALRPYLLRLQVTRIGIRPQSMTKSLHIVAAVCLVIIALVTARIGALMLTSDEASLAAYILVLILYMFVVISGFIMYVRNWQSGLKILIDSLWQLSSQIQVIPKQGIPILSEDETAGLALTFNKLQRQLAEMHGELAEQLTLARDIQQRLMPKVMPSAASVQAVAYCQPCFEVGGDFYDVIKLDDHKIVVAIGDVSGKGMSAAMLMSAVLAALRSEVAIGRSPGEILTKLNKQIYHITQGKAFVTLGLAIIDEVNQQAFVDYASAGHMAPYLLHADGHSLKEIDCSALPLGMVEDECYENSYHRFQLSDGQVLIMYTDGVVEALDKEQQLFGFERWEQVLTQLNIAKQPLSLALQRILQQIPSEDAQKKTDEDDRTVVLVRYNKIVVNRTATSTEGEALDEEN